MKVPLIDITRQNREIESDLQQSVLRVLRSGRYILGEEVAAFESEMAAYIGAANGVGVGSGTDAIMLIIKSLGIGPEDEVIVPAFTFIATAGAVANCGATPVFADIDAGTFNIDPGSAERKLTEHTKAIIAVHLYGQPADMDALGDLAKRSGVFLVEDCAQAAGAVFKSRKAGSFGIASAFSFFPTKNLGCAGDGGMVCTDDDEVAERVKKLRNHGSSGGYESDLLGTNSRLDEIQAALLRVKLERLDEWNEGRRAAASIYDKNLSFVETPALLEGATHVYHQYTVKASDRDGLAGALGRTGIDSRVYYPIPLHLQPCLKSLGYKAGNFPESERAAREVLSLPMFAGITGEEVQTVCAAVNEFACADTTGR